MQFYSKIGKFEGFDSNKAATLTIILEEIAGKSLD